MAVQIAQIVDVQSLNGQEILNVFHFFDSSGVASITTLCQDYVEDVVLAANAFQSTNLSHTSLRYRQLWPAATLTHTYTTGLPASGTISAGDDEPSSTALSMQFYIGNTVVLAGGFTGHIKRSGCRMGGIREGYINGNGTAGGIVALTDAWFAELLTMDSDGWVPCVVSMLNGARVRQPIAQAYALITGYSGPSPSTQNTRKVLRGRTS